MPAQISVFLARSRNFQPYEAVPPDVGPGGARIARLVGRGNSESMGAGVVEYSRVTVDWDLPFDEVITLLEGTLTLRSAGHEYLLHPGDVAWFPAHTPVT